MTFREGYCKRFGCPTDDFERHLLMQCVKPLRRPFAWLVWVLRRSSLEIDLGTIRSLGDCESMRPIIAAASEINHTRREPGFVRTVLGVRVSGRRLMHFASEVFDPPEDWNDKKDSGSDVGGEGSR